MFGKVEATVIFVQDLEKCVAFYRDLIGFRVTFNDDVSYGFALEGQDFLLLQTSAAAEMVGEAALLPGGVSGSRVLLCAGVENVDTVYEALTAKGVAFLKPPEDKPWGRRTAYFADPEGNLWELFHHLPQ
jgi:catechol 2,3-dioxygenase-like lactoylglutathione lyase family enzyme